MYALRQVAVLQERTKRGKIMSSARLSTEALGSCLRRVICRGGKEGKPSASTARWLFVLPNEAKRNILAWQPNKKGLQSSRSSNPSTLLLNGPGDRLGDMIAQSRFLGKSEAACFVFDVGLAQKTERKPLQERVL